MPVNLLEKGEKSDKILVKNCDVNVKATAKAKQIIKNKTASVNRLAVYFLFL